MEEMVTTIGLLSRLLVAAVLLVAGVRKLRSPSAFRISLAAHRVPVRVQLPVSYGVPIAEVLLGALLLSGFEVVIVATAASILFFVFGATTVSAFGLKGTVDCGCFGASSRPQTSVRVAGRATALACMSALMGLSHTGAESHVIVVGILAGALALVLSLSSFDTPVRRESDTRPNDPGRRRFLKLAASSAAGVVIGSLTGMFGKPSPVEARCYGCGSCGTDYIFLYCTGGCCAAYFIQPYDYCETFCAYCTARIKVYCGIPACC